MKTRLNMTVWLVMVSLMTVPVLGQSVLDTSPKGFKISGNVGVPGVSMRGLPGNVVSDQSGQYSANVADGWTGSIMPAKEGYVFTPRFVKYNVVESRYDSQDYAAKVLKFEISGNVGVPDALLKSALGMTLSDSRGNYAVEAPYGWNGTIKPEKDGLKFEPICIEFANVTGNHRDQNFSVIAPILMMTSSNPDVLVVPTTEVKPNQFSAIQQDMRVMLHILKKAVQDEKNPLVGGVFSQYGNLLGRNESSLQSLYIQGYGALFFVQASFPLEWSSEPVLAVPSGGADEPSADPVWQQAKNQVFNPAAQANQPKSSRRDTEAMMRKLMEGLKHAANIRYLSPEESVTVTVQSGSEESVMFGMSAGSGGGMSGGGYGGRSSRRNSRSGYDEAPDMYGGGGGALYGYDQMSSSGGRGGGRSSGFAASSGPSMSGIAPKSAITFQVSKARIDDFAEGKMGLDDFIKAVNIISF